MFNQQWHADMSFALLTVDLTGSPSVPDSTGRAMYSMAVLYAPRSSLPAVEYRTLTSGGSIPSSNFPVRAMLMDVPGYYLMRIDEVSSTGQYDTRGVVSVERLLNGKHCMLVFS